MSSLLLRPSWLTQLCVPLPPSHGSRRRHRRPGCSGTCYRCGARHHSCCSAAVLLSIAAAIAIAAAVAARSAVSRSASASAVLQSTAARPAAACSTAVLFERPARRLRSPRHQGCPRMLRAGQSPGHVLTPPRYALAPTQTRMHNHGRSGYSQDTARTADSKKHKGRDMQLLTGRSQVLHSPVFLPFLSAGAPLPEDMPSSCQVVRSRRAPSFQLVCCCAVTC